MAVTIVQQHSIGHLFYAVMLAGLLQIAFGALGLSARLLRLLPSTCMMVRTGTYFLFKPYVHACVWAHGARGVLFRAFATGWAS